MLSFLLSVAPAAVVERKKSETKRCASTKAYRMSYVLNILLTNEIKYSEYIPVQYSTVYTGIYCIYCMYSTIYERTRYVLVEQVDPTKEVSKN